MEPRAFNREVKGEGIGITTVSSKVTLRIPKANEAQHIAIIGDTGTGKSTLTGSSSSRSATGRSRPSSTTRHVSSSSAFMTRCAAIPS